MTYSPGGRMAGEAARRGVRVLLGLCLALSVPLAGAAAQTPAALGRVVQQRGPVTAIREASPRMLFLGAPLGQGDTVMTGPASRVQIELADGALLSVGPDSQVVLREVAVDASGTGLRGLLSLVIGIVRASLGGRTWSRGFEIETRAAVASVRATDWIVEAKPDQTSVFVVEGRVDVAPSAAGAAPVALEAGFGTDVPRGGAAAQVKQWGAKRVEDVLARTRVP